MLQPFVVDPNSYDKYEEFKRAQGYVERFLDMNKLSHVKKLIIDAPPKSKAHNRWRDYGWYRFDEHAMFINVKKSRPPVKTPGFAWTYTGFKSDLTAPGILAHETGHHIHNLYEQVFDRKQLFKAIRIVRSREPKVSGYEPNLYETFAEMLRLFIMNPVLLAEGRPVRYAFLTKNLSLRPPHDIHWRIVLKNAHPRLVLAAENWARK